MPDSTGTLKVVKMGKMLRTNETHMYFDDPDSSKIYAFNKSRVPRYKTWVKTEGHGSDVTQEQIHEWLDPSPYDYILSLNYIPPEIRPAVPYYTFADQSRDPDWKTKALSGDFSGASSTFHDNSQVTLQNYDISGDTLYVIYRKQPVIYRYDAGYDDYGSYSSYAYDPSYTYYGESNYYAVTYDLHTGQYITHSNVRSNPNVIKSRDSNDSTIMRAKGDNMVVFHQPLSGGALTYVEFNREGKIVKYGNISLPSESIMATYKYTRPNGSVVQDPGPTPYYCYYSIGNISKEIYNDDRGNIYFFAENICKPTSGETNKDLNQYDSPETPVGMYVIRMDLNTFTAEPFVRTGGNKIYYGSQSPFHIPTENIGIMALNSFTGELFTRTFKMNGDTLEAEFHERINLNTGAKSAWGIPLKYYYPSFYMKPDGQYPNGTCVYSASGTCDRFSWHYPERIWYHGNIAGSNSGHTVSNNFAQYIGDGMYVSGYDGVSGGNYLSGSYLYLDVGAVNPTEVFKGIRLGQFVSDITADNSQMTFSMTLRKPTTSPSKLAGFSFRMLDPMNRYAVEADGNTVYLSKYVGGNRTVLGSVGYPFAANQAYSFRIKAVGSRIDVWLNGIPVFSDIQDTTFASGKMGPFSDKPYVDFGAISNKAVSKDIQWLSNYAIWEEGTATADVRYKNITFTDPENDPIAGSYQWTYTHTPKFIKNQGLSSLNGQTFSSERLTFDKVGVYAVTLRAKDDPFPAPQYKYPNMIFDPYRKSSNPFQQLITVHRRPIAQFTLTTGSDGVINWNDTSYDPDRYDPATNTFSPSEDGKVYTSNRGVFERKYWYATPSGEYFDSKLTRPVEAGTYEVFMAVRDEYGAWSQPASQTIVSAGNVPQNSKPTVQLTYPNGTNADPSLLFTSKPQIRWNQYDTAGTVFRGYHVKVMYETGQIFTESGEAAQSTASNSATWNVPIDLPVGVKFQVQVRVSDGESWSDWSNIGWMRVNSPPTVTLTYPNGANETTPNIINTRRPSMSWIQNDIDGQRLQSFRLQIIQRNNNGTETTVYDVTRSQNDLAGTKNFAVDSDLPNGVLLYARVMVSDGYLWSNWSNIGWFRINFAPAPELTFPTGTFDNPSIGGTLPLITWNQTDPDPNTLYTKYQVIIAREDGIVLVDSGQVLQNVTTGTGSFQVQNPLPAGIKVQVRVKVWDEYVESPWSMTRWMLTNRPPKALFSWKVNPPVETFEDPAWEGDHIQLINQSTDPDGDQLTLL